MSARSRRSLQQPGGARSRVSLSRPKPGDAASGLAHAGGPATPRRAWTPPTLTAHASLTTITLQYPRGPQRAFDMGSISCGIDVGGTGCN